MLFDNLALEGYRYYNYDKLAHKGIAAMRISTRGRYGTRAMLDLALHYDGGSVMVKDIARRQQLSGRYLEQLFVSLRVAGMVRSSRGTRGGFALARPPSQIGLGETIRAGLLQS